MIPWLFGLDPDAAISITGLSFRTGWASWVMVFLLLGAIGVSFWLYRQEKTLRPWERIVLSALRMAAMAVLIVALFQPAIEIEVQRPVQSNVLVLLDRSASMAIEDVRKDPADLAEAAMALHVIEFKQSERPAAIRQAEDNMQHALDLLRAGEIETARDAQTQAAEALTQLRELMQNDYDEGKLAPGAMDQLRSLAEAQKVMPTQLAVDSGRADSQIPAQKQMLQDFRLLAPELRNEVVEVPEKQKGPLGKTPRWRMVQGVWSNPELELTKKLSEIGQVRFFTFAESLDSVAEPDLSADKVTGSSTYLGEAMEEVVSRYAGSPIAGVLVMTDGANNGGLDPQGVARRLGQRGVPVYAVGIGLANPDDLVLHSIVAQDVVFGGDLVPIRVQLNSTGYERRATTLSVQLDGQEVARKSVVLTGQSQLEEISFAAETSPGPKLLEVTLQPLADEAILENNTIRRTVRVVDEKIKVLYVEGSPRWEYRYLRAILKRDPRMETTFLMTEGDRELARASSEHIARFPDDPEETFKYDLVILGDVKSTHFTPTQLQRLEQLVRERGGSLIVLAGHKYLPADYLDTPLMQMLPVWIEPTEWEQLNKDVYPVLTDAGQKTTVMSLDGTEARNRALWANCKPLSKAPPVTGAKRGAVVLAVLSDAARRAEPLPIIAWGRYGSGKVMFVGTDRLWRLRQKVGDLYHTRFWSQAIQFLSLSRLLGENARIHFETHPRVVHVGEPVEIYANVLNESYQPSHAPRINAEVRQSLDEFSAGAPISLRAVPGMAGLFHGVYTPREEGHFQVTAPEEPAGVANLAEFDVIAGTGEQLDPAMRQKDLRKIADLSDGMYSSVRGIPRLVDAMQARDRIDVLHRRIEIWDSWMIVMAFVVLASVEWIWRRRRDLV